MTQSAFGAQSTAGEVVAGHDLSGQTILITGGSTGIGFAATRALLSAGAEVVMAARDEVRGEQAEVRAAACCEHLSRPVRCAACARYPPELSVHGRPSGDRAVLA